MYGDSLRQRIDGTQDSEADMHIRRSRPTDDIKDIPKGGSRKLFLEGHIDNITGGILVHFVPEIVVAVVVVG